MDDTNERGQKLRLVFSGRPIWSEEDSGQAKIGRIDTSDYEEVFVRVQSWDEECKHAEIAPYLNSPIRVVIEVAETEEVSKEIKTMPEQKTEATIDDLFTYHVPTPDQVSRYSAINEAAKLLAKTIDEFCPPSADRTAAVRLVQQARMTANASIALSGRSYR